MGAINVPTSRKVWGCSIGAKKSHGIGASYPSAWRAMWDEFDWTGWFKPQIDYTVANGVGCNAIRVFGSLEGVFLGTYSQATYSAHWQQVVDYCASFNPPVWVYFVGGWSPQIQQNGMTDQQVADGVIATLAALAGRTNILGIDLIQEANDWGTNWGGSGTAARCINIASLVRAGGTTLPITFSNTFPMTGGTSQSWIASIASALDYLDFHPYEQAGWSGSSPVVMADLNYWRTTYPNMDILFGEFGHPESKTYDEIAQFFRSVLTVANSGDPRMRGALMWDGIDGDDASSNAWGMYSTSLVPRLARQRLVRQFAGGSVARNN